MSSILEHVSPLKPPDCDTLNTNESKLSSSDSSSDGDLATNISILGVNAPVSFGSVPHLTIEGTFPSLITPLKLFRAAAKKRDVDLMQTPAVIFLTNLRSVYLSLKTVPKDIREDHRFTFAKYQLRFSMDGFRDYISHPPPAKVSGFQRDHIQDALHRLDITMSHLQAYLDALNEIVAERKVAETSPQGSLTLPKSPAPAPTPAPAPVAHNDHIALKPPSPELDDKATIMTATTLVANSGSTDTLVTQKTMRTRNVFLRKFLRAFNKSKASLSSSSSATLVELPPLSDTSTIVEVIQPKKALEVPYDPRRSAIYFPVDMDVAKIDIENLMPVMEGSNIRLTSEGDLKAASFSSLVRILTSPEASRITDFTHIFFMCFRFFSSPDELCSALIKRFNVLSEWTKPNQSTIESQFIASQAEQVRVSVVRAFTTWLWEYWRPESDTPVLQKIMKFVVDEVVCNVEDLLMAWGLAQAVWRIETGKSRRGIKVKSTSFEEKLTEIVPPVPTGFKIFQLCLDGPPSVYKILGSEAGREEFARQLTIKATDLFSSVNPSDAIALWKGATKGLDKVRRKVDQLKAFEKAICTWVIDSILQKEKTVERTVIAEFWIDVALRLVALRNYSSAFAVYSALVTSPLYRLKTSLGLVTRYLKDKYLALEKLFDRSGNFAAYRAALESEKKPTVPLIFSLQHDIAATEAMSAKIPASDNDIEKTLINFVPLRTIMKTMSSMEACRIPYCLRTDEDFQDWLKGQLGRYQLSQQEEQQFMGKLFDLSKMRELEPAQLKGSDIWRHSIPYYWPDYPGPYRSDIPLVF